MIRELYFGGKSQKVSAFKEEQLLHLFSHMMEEDESKLYDATTSFSAMQKSLTLADPSEEGLSF